MEKITKENVRKIRSRLDEVLKELGQELGVSLTTGNGQYSDSSTGYLKVEIATLGQNGEVNSKEAEDFKRIASCIGLKPEDLGRTFNSRGNTYKINGYSSKSRKYPILAEKVGTGITYKFTSDDVVRLLG